MRPLTVAIIILFSKSVSSQAKKRKPTGPLCDMEYPVAACCPPDEEFPQACVPFNLRDPLCFDRSEWWCCFDLEGDFQVPGREDYTHHGIECRKAFKYLYDDQKQSCPAPAPAPEITNPFQPIEDFFNLYLKDEGKSSLNDAECPYNPNPNPNPESLLPSSETFELSSIADGPNNDINNLFTQNEGGNPAGSFFLNDQDWQNNIAMTNDLPPLAQNNFGFDDLGTAGVDFDGFLDHNNDDDDALFGDINQFSRS